MARTFRRKGFEKTQKNRPFNKTAGYFTQIEDHSVIFDEGEYRRCSYWQTGRVPTTQELNNDYWALHRDRGFSWEDPHTGKSSSPGKLFKAETVLDRRVLHKKQLQQWLRNPDYEIIDHRVPCPSIYYLYW